MRTLLPLIAVVLALTACQTTDAATRANRQPMKTPTDVCTVVLNDLVPTAVQLGATLSGYPDNVLNPTSTAAVAPEVVATVTHLADTATALAAETDNENLRTTLSTVASAVATARTKPLGTEAATVVVGAVLHPAGLCRRS